MYEEQVSESKLRELLSYSLESDTLDFKEKIDCESKRSRVEICKDIIAMANTSGGYIVFGVRDDDFYPIGLQHGSNISLEKLADTLDNYVGERVEILLAHHNLMLEGEQRLFALLYIPPASTPIVTAKEGAYSEDGRQKVIFGKAEWLVRTHARSQRAEPADVRKLLHQRQSPSAPLLPTAPLNDLPIEPPVLHNLPRPNFIEFIGREKQIAQIRSTLKHPRAWTVSIEGIGGVGKTALAQKVALDLASEALQTGQSDWKFIIWISAKETVLGLNGIEHVQPGFRTLEDLIDVILDTTGFQRDHWTSFNVKRSEAIEVLQSFPCLLIVDNLETLVDDTVEKFLIDDLPAPSKAILTSRHKTTQRGGQVILLEGMELEQSLDFLRTTAHTQGSKVIETASDSILGEIHTLTAGIALALKLVVGQTALGTNLEVVLDRLKNHRSADILDFCFTETYRTLSISARQMLGAVAFFETPATIHELAMVAGLSPVESGDAIESLIRVSLINESFDDAKGKQVYSLLPLTRIFVEEQVKKWEDFHVGARQRFARYSKRAQQILSRDQEINQKSIAKAQPRNDLEVIAVGLTDMAEAAFVDGDYQKALELLKEAEILAPRFSYVQQEWAWIENRKIHFSEASQRYQLAIEYDPDSTETYYYWAKLEAKRREFQKSIELHKEVRLRQPTNVENNLSLSYTLYKLGKEYRRDGKVFEAGETFQEALEVLRGLPSDIDPSQPRHKKDSQFLRYCLNRAQILEALNRPRQALDACDQGLDVKKDDYNLNRIANRLSERLGYD
jgi:hypothetical protein